MHEAASPSGMAQVHPPDRGRDAEAPRPASDCRQLRYPQASDGQSMAGQAFPVPHALHTDFGVLAQPGRALFRPDHRGQHPLWCLQKRIPARSYHSKLSGPPQCRSKTLRLDRFRNRHSRKSGSRETSVRVGTLATTAWAPARAADNTAAWPALASLVEPHFLEVAPIYALALRVLGTLTRTDERNAIGPGLAASRFHP